MRGIFQEHQNVVYVFIGSQESMIREIIQNKNNPFYKFGKQITLSKINRYEFEKFISVKFKNKKIPKCIINKILDFTGCQPYYTQQLCYEIYNLIMNGWNFDENIIEIAITQIITEHNSDYKKWWSNLNTTEKKIVVGIVFGNFQPTSHDLIKRFGINSASTSGSALKKLFDTGILIKEKNHIKIEDPFWEKWIYVNRDK